MDVVEAKEIVRAEIDRLTPTLLEVSHSIHANPELNFEEHHAHDTLTGVLEDEGLAVERGAYDMATAFESRVGADDGPTVAVLCEYDASGHRPRLRAQHHRRGRSRCWACRRQGRRGARRSCCDPRHTCRRGGGGKEFMIRRGAFDDIDLAMMVHPADRDLRTMHTIAVQQLDVQYTGRAAHAAASPHTGLNALDAAVLGYNAVAALRQHIRRRSGSTGSSPTAALSPTSSCRRPPPSGTSEAATWIPSKP